MRRHYIVIAFLLASVFGGNNFTILHAQSLPVKNDVFWNTQDHQPINSQGGGIFKFPDPASGKIRYYWYGVHYKEADLYRNDPSITLPSTTFESVTCYSSTDLVNWHFDNDILTKDELKKHSDRPTWVGRLGVAYIKQLKKYVMFVQHGNKVLITVCDTPNGNFNWHQEISMKEMIGTSNTGDQTVFTDEENGTSYLVYSYGNGRNKIYVSEIGVKDGMVNLLDCKQVYQGASREGNCMFKYKGKYYMFASNIYGWDSSLPYYLVANDVRGPYLPANDMQVMKGSEQDYAHITQTGFFVNVKGSKKETVIYCGDRWAEFAGNGLGYNQWFPLSINHDTPYFNSISSWMLNAKTGKWKIAPDNNYIKNGSFEADRKKIPSIVKPVQQQLTGWSTNVVKGNSISLDSLASPVLNHENSASDRKIVIGEKCLAITDKIEFQRKIFQQVRSTPFVKLKNGRYTLTAKIKNNSDFNKLEIYVSSGGKIFKKQILEINSDWKTINIENVIIRNHKAEVGLLAHGKANAFCYVDDVSLVLKH
jgi:hypothetical protein